MPGVSEPLRVVLLGNSFAAKVQLPALRAAGGNRVIGIAGADRARAERTAAEWEIPHATGDYRELLELDPDLVLVTTPVDLHFPMVRAALATRAAILCEKPFTLNAFEADELVAEARGRGAWIDHQLRWSPVRRRVRELLRRGGLGELRHVELRVQVEAQDFAARAYRWWNDEERGGGALGALGSHMVDIVRSEAGEVARVRCELRTLVPERAAPDGGSPRRCTADEVASLWLELEGGATAHLLASVGMPGDRTFFQSWFGSDAALRLLDEEELALAPHGEPFAPLPDPPRLPTADEVGMPDLGPFARCLPGYLTGLLDAVREGNTDAAHAATFVDGLAVQRVLDAAQRSAEDGGGWQDCR